jgi:hypothetical protein
VRRVVDSAADLYWGSGICDDVPALSWFLAAGLVPLALGMTALGAVPVFLVLAGVLFTCYVAPLALLVGAALAARRDRAVRLRSGGRDHSPDSATTRPDATASCRAR